MGIFDFNFHFGNKDRKRVEELSNEEFEKIKFKARVAFVDDEEVPNLANLTREGYNIAKFSDIEDIDNFVRNKYHVAVLDIQGVGGKIAGKREGWGILDYLKKEHPHIVIIVFTGADWSITKYKDLADKADFILGKDSEYLDFKLKLDAAIRKAFSIKFHVEILRTKIKNESTFNGNEDDIINSILKYGKDRHLALKKIKTLTTNDIVIQRVENLLSIFSSIYSLIP